MEPFTVDFGELSQLREMWLRNFSMGTCFVPTTRKFPLQSEVPLLLRVPTSNFGVLLLSRVIQMLQGAGPKGTGVVFELPNVSHYSKMVDQMLNEEPLRSGVQDLLSHGRVKGMDEPTLKPLLQRCRDIAEATKAKDLYRILGVDKAASRKEIRDKYFQLTRELHPDSYEDKDLSDDVARLLEDGYQKICQAYEVLRDETRKKAYDSSRGLTLRVRGESEKDFQLKKAQQFQNRYLKDNAENVQKAERLFQEAQKSVAEGEIKSAIATIRIALTFDPMNAKYKKTLAELEKKRP